MANITINDKKIAVDDGITIIQACEQAGIEIPRFCYHERLKIAGNCRMCLVEVKGGPPKPVASCAMQVMEGMDIKTDSKMVKKAREGVMEFLLINHPLDCPICDQGGECDLQDQAHIYGCGSSRYKEEKRAVEDKDMGPLIKTHMTRCIQCTRCVRFIEDVAGTVELGAAQRGENMEITTYLNKAIKSEVSGNIIDLCPVGALTSKPYAFKARSWELNKVESIDIMDAIGSNIRVDSRGLEVMRILPRLNEEINEEWISDKTRFCYDGLKYQRLDKVFVKQNNQFKASNFDEAFDKISQKLNEIDTNEVAALVGDLAAVDEIYALKKLMEKIGSDNLDCRNFKFDFDLNDRNSYLFNSTISGIDEADSCLLVGVNPRVDAAILNVRIRKNVVENGLKVSAIGVNADLTYDYDNLGDDAEILNKILDGKHEYSKTLKKKGNHMIVIGMDVLSRLDGSAIVNICRAIAEKYDLISEDFNGFNILQRHAGQVGALDVGFVSKNNKITSEKIINDAKKGKIKMLYLLGADNYDLHGLKDSDCFIIYQGSHGDEAAQIADIVLPASDFTQKNALYVNLEGRLQETTRAVDNMGDAQEDCKIILDLAKYLDIDLGFKNQNALRNSLIKEKPFLSEVDQIIVGPWQKSDGICDLSVDNSLKIAVKKRNFYNTNVITKFSKTLSSIDN